MMATEAEGRKGELTEDLVNQARRIALEELEICAAGSMDMRALRNSKVLAVRVGALTESLWFQLHALVWAHQVDEVKKCVSYPADWWQAFKQRWFPACLVERWPIRCHRHDIILKRYVTYPDCALKFKESGETSVTVIDSSASYKEDKCPN